MANKNDNLIPEAHKLTLEDQSNGGKRSGEVRRERANLRKTLNDLLNETYKGDKTYKDMATLGLIVGAIKGKAENYKVIAQVLGELDEPTNVETPVVNINVVDNTELEKALYEDNN
jgi:hypothetical protein